MFWIYPRHWGLKGRSLEEARIRYQYGHDPHYCEVEIAKLDYPQLFDDATPTDEDEEYLLAEEKSYKADVLDIDLKYGKITKAQYDEKLADLNGEGWVKILNVHYDPDVAARASFELDYNEAFVEELREQGYPGVTGEEVVSAWMDHLFFVGLTEGMDAEMADDIKSKIEATK